MWSADLTPRERLLSPWLIGTLGALVGLALALMFPRERLEARLLEGGKVDALSVAYLEAWLRVRPNDGEFLSVLAAQYVRTGRLEEAEAMVARMRALHDASLEREALLLDIAIREQRAYALQPTDPKRVALLNDLRGLLKQALGFKWTVAELEILATKARGLDLGPIAVQLYQRLAKQDVAHATHWQARTAEIALGVGEYRAAAAANFAAQAAATSLDEQRRYFIAGLQALQGGNLFDEAMTEAQRRVGPLIDDTETLRFLTRLAMACNRPDLADQYARRLLHLTWRQAGEGIALASGMARHDWAFAGRPEPLPSPADALFMDGPEGLARRQRHAARIRHVADKGTEGSGAGGAQPSPRGMAPFNADDYDLAYRVFMGSGNLNDALRVAEAAVRQRPDLKIWTERAAQVAEWNHQPMAALNYWLAYAQSTGDDAAWQNVLRLAPALNEDHAYLAALRYKASRQPGDMKLLDQVIAAYERLGEPVEGLAYLDSIARGPHRQAILERYAILAERAGKDDQAYDTYVRLQKEFGPNAPQSARYALKLANMLYVRGQFEQALTAMQVASKVASPTDDLYWRTFAQLARLNQRDDLSREAYRQLLIGGNAEPDDLASMIEFYDASPIDAGRLAELAFRKDGAMVRLQQALSYYTRARAFRRIEGLLASLTPEQRRAAEQSPGVLGARAEYYRQSGQWAAAMGDLRRAVSLPDAGSDVKAAYLWGLLDSGKNDDLKRALALWRGEAENDSVYWGAYAAAGLQLFDANLALRFLGRQGKSMQNDPLWLLAYADARDMAGQADAAWRLRREAWWLLWRADGQNAKGGKGEKAAANNRRAGTRVTIGDDDAVPADDDARTELRARRVSLAQTFGSGDLAQRLLIELLRDDRRASKLAREGGRASVAASELGDLDVLPPEPPETPANHREQARKQARVSDQLVSAVAKEAALGWALSREANDLARAWLLQQYTRRMTRPAYAEISIALAERDLQTLNRLLDDTADRLPLYNRIDANVVTDRLGEAQRLAFEGLTTAPDDEQLHERVRETLLTNAQALEPRETWFKQAPLTYFESSAAAGIRITDHTSMLVRATQRNQRSTDDTQLTGVPAQDRSVDWISQYQTQNTQWKGTVGWRQGLASFTAFRLDGLLGQTGPLATEVSVGRNQPANETPQLRVGGVKDLVSIGGNWRLTQRQYVRARVEGDRFYGQDRSFLGSGMVFDGEIGHRFRVEYPDYTIRVVGTYARYNASGSPSALLGRLVPGDAAPNINQFMPGSFAQFGVLFGFGMDYLDRYTRAWRPFMDVGLLHDNREGMGTQVQLGVAGSVFGNDHLALYLEHASITRAGTSPMTEIGLRYRWLY